VQELLDVIERQRAAIVDHLTGRDPGERE
jgi:hypothetical protein